MKKIITILLMITSVIVFVGCDSVTNNEIYNKSYNVGMIDISDLEQLTVAVIEKAEKAVVGVSNYQKTTLNYELAGVGSGVVYRGIAHMKDESTKELDETINSNDVDFYEYFVVTNRHVIAESDKLKVYLGTLDKEVDATLIQFDDQVDLSVVTFNSTLYINPLKFADSDLIKKGNFAIAIGSPSGYEYFGSATFGIISHPKRYLADDTDNDGVTDWDAEYIQHDVAINPGNSGGPLINMAGEVIGINTMKFVSEDIDNMGFSIPSNLVKEIVPLLEKGIKPQRAKLGVKIVSLRDLDEAGYVERNIPTILDFGMYIAEINNEGVAQKANLQVGDIIISFNNIDIKYSYQLRAELGKFIIGSGTTAEIVVYRDNSYVTKIVTF